MHTKWEILQSRLAEAKEKFADLEREIKGLETTPCDLRCGGVFYPDYGGCGEYFETEADFAKHFVIPDTRFLNLGWCPHSDRIPSETIYNR